MYTATTFYFRLIQKEMKDFANYKKESYNRKLDLYNQLQLVKDELKNCGCEVEFDQVEAIKKNSGYFSKLVSKFKYIL